MKEHCPHHFCFLYHHFIQTAWEKIILLKIISFMTELKLPSCIKISPSIFIHFVFNYLFSNKYEIFVFDLLPYFVNCLTLHYILYMMHTNICYIFFHNSHGCTMPTLLPHLEQANVLKDTKIVYLMIILG